MTTRNTVQRLNELNTGTEVWWDSSPLIYRDWLNGAGKPHREAGLFHLSPTDDQTPFAPDSLLQGSTTNQPLTLQVIEQNPAHWATWLREQAPAPQALPPRELMWRLFIEVARRGANLLSDIFKASEYRRGQICCQVDPRDLTDRDAMLAQARRIHHAAPNIMVKMPGTREGIDGVRILTSEGIPTNVTLGFTVSQLVAVGKAAQAGLEEARQKGTDLKYWRSCATMMLGRYEDAPPLKEQASALGIALSEAEVRWAGIAIFRKAYRLFQERGYPSKLMAASMRLGPTIEGRRRVWHLEQLAGGKIVMTVFPNILEAFLADIPASELGARIDEPVPGEVLERLCRIPYFVQAYEEQGIAPEDFVSHPALQATAASFSQAMDKIEHFASAS